MKNILTIFKKEFNSYLNSPGSYITILIYLFITGWYFSSVIFVTRQAELRLVFDITPILFIFVIPALTMKSFAEEKKTGTIELLLTLPLNDIEIIIGKFLANFFLVFIALILTFPQVFTVKILGNPDFGIIFAGYIGLLLFSGAIISIGLFASSLSENQIIAFIISFIITAFLFYIDKVLIFFPLALQKIFEYISLNFHLNNIMKGVIDSRDVIYYLSIMLLFITFNKSSLESRNN